MQAEHLEYPLARPEQADPGSLGGVIRRALLGPQHSLSADQVVDELLRAIGAPPTDTRRDVIHRIMTSGRSTFVRHFDAGSCGLCEMALSFAVLFPRLEAPRFGVQLVASPRHADTLVVIGPLTASMLPALKETVEAMPRCRLVLTGDCASGRLRCCSPEVCAMWPPELEQRVAVRVYGNPPSPRLLLLALLLLNGPPGEVETLIGSAGVLRSPDQRPLLEFPFLARQAAAAVRPAPG